MRPPLVVAWEVTRACPLACRHCRAAAQRTGHPAELTFDEGLAFVRDLSRAHPGAVLVLTGGEPLTRPDTLRLAAAAGSLGLNAALSVDVGRLLTPETCRSIRLAGIRRLSFSLHFPDAARSDAFASTPGFFAGALEGLANVRAAGIPFQLHTTVMKSNVRLLQRIAPARRRARRRALGALLPRPDRAREAARRPGAAACRAGARASLALPAAAELVRSRSSRSARRTSGASRRRARASAASGAPTRVTSRLTTMSRGCMSGNGFAFVSHVGDVCGCGFLPLVRRQRARPAVLRAVRARTAVPGVPRPGAARRRLRHLRVPRLCGGCRARAYAATGDPLAEEPDCAYAPTALAAI